MNVLFLTIGWMESVEAHGIYPDLIRQFRDHGHNVYIVGHHEKRTGKNTECLSQNGVHMLYVRLGNITKCGWIEKGISTLSIKQKYLRGIKNYFPDVKFDLVLYSTPPITLVGVVEYIKKRDGAETYLLLKDIFPQNAVDIGIMTKKGMKGLLYRYFRNKEKALYAVSDTIGCMSEANVEYILKQNSQIESERVCVCPNCVEPRDLSISLEEKKALREKYGIPLHKKVFVYGGNLGRPQGIPFLIECLRSQKDNPDVLFLIVGDGTEYHHLESFLKDEKQENVMLMQRLPKEDYDHMIAACDVGMIFLDHRFTIPNFPSRLLAYMQAGIPVLACTDPNTDIGKVITDGQFGWWCESNDVSAFGNIVNEILTEDDKFLPEKEFAYLTKHYSSEFAYSVIMKSLDC